MAISTTIATTVAVIGISPAPPPGPSEPRDRTGLNRLSAKESPQIVGQLPGRTDTGFFADFSRHFRQIVSKSRGTWPLSRRGCGASS